MASVHIPQPVQHPGSTGPATVSQQQVHEMYMVRSSHPRTLVMAHLGYPSLPSDEEDIGIRVFVSGLAEKAAKIPIEMDDLHPRCFVSLQSVFDFRNIMRPQEDLFVFHHLLTPNAAWLLGVRSAEAALYVVRYIVFNTNHNSLTIAHRLLKYGIPFHTLLYRPSRPIPRPVPVQYRFRFSNHVFNIVDFNSALLACKSLLQGRAGRAALMRGGIIGRIAREFVSYDAVYEGPSGDAIRGQVGLAIEAEAEGYQYWDDVLTENDITIICGSYAIPTGMYNF